MKNITSYLKAGQEFNIAMHESTFKQNICIFTPKGFL